MQIKPIKTVKDNEELWEAIPNTPEADELEVLITSIHAFEEENYPISTTDPIEAIRFRMEQQKNSK